MVDEAGSEPSDPTPGVSELLAAAFTGTDALVVVLGPDGRALVANPAMTRATGWTREELAARPFWELYVAPEDAEHAQRSFAASLARGAGFAVEGDWLDRSGGRRRMSMQVNILRDAAGRPCASCTVAVDVTEQRRREEELRQHAETDALTGLRNRRALFQALTAELAGPSGSGVGLLFCDLDGLKQANDDHGHHAGDLVLVATAQRLRAVTGVSDVVGRFGGDEFVILCPGADAERLAVLAARAEAAVSRPVRTPDAVVEVGVSIGTAVGAAGADPDELVRAADRRMYRVKTSRRTSRR